VDNWRRKTTIQLARASKANIDSTQASMQLNTGQVVNNNTKSISQEKDSAVQLNIQLIQTDTDLKQSKINWNNNSLSIAKIFLYELNEF